MLDRKEKNCILDKLKDGVSLTADEWMSIMPPSVFARTIENHYDSGIRKGAEDKQNEVICRLLASGIPEEEISVVLRIKMSDVENVASSSKKEIESFSKQLRARRKSHERRL